MALPKIGISIGDIQGIGPEVIIKALMDGQLLRYATPVIYAAPRVLTFYKSQLGEGPFHFQNIDNGAEAREGKVSLVTCWSEQVEIQPGSLSELGGRLAYLSLERATRELREGQIDAMVTAPIHKKAMEMAGFPEVGHTEYLGRQFEGSEPLMLLVSDTLRVGVVTGHVPLSAVPPLLSKERIIQRIRAFQQTLKVDFGIERPVIAVLGLNPHAGDGGLIGEEDEQLIRPAIIECKKNGLLVTGPHPADGFFGSGSFARVDGILAMYHDQGLIPFKTLSFGRGVNYTAGLPVVRTSPDHGVAFDVAGQGKADPTSFRQAFLLALDVLRQRRQHAEWHANPLQTRDTFRKGEDERVDR